MRPSSSPRHPTKTTLVIFLSFLLVFLGINLLMIGPYLLAILMGVILASILSPLYAWLREAGTGRRTAALIITLGILFLGLAPVGGFTYMSVRQGIELGQRLSAGPTLDIDSLGDRISSLKMAKVLGVDPVEVKSLIRNFVRELGASGSRLLLDLAGGVPGKLLQLTLALLSCYFMLTDGKTLRAWITDKVPMEPDVRRHVYKSFNETAFSVIFASFAAAFLQSLLMLGAYLVLRVPLAFFAAGVTFILSWFPIIGTAPAWIAGAAYLFINDNILAGSAMVAVGLFIGVADNLMRAWVLRGRNDIHPLVSIVVIVGGIEMFGLFGVFFGPVLMGVFLSLAEVWPMVARRFQLIPSDTKTGTPSAPMGLTRGAPESRSVEARTKNAG